MAKNDNVEFGKFRKNIMGTLSFEMKLPNMRKAQDFIVYPVNEKTNYITIQSDTRFGKIEMTTGRGLMSQSHANGAYAVHLHIDKLVKFELTESQLEKLKEELAKTAGRNVGSAGVVSDNEYADKFAKGGGFDQYGNPMGFERDYDTVYEIHHKPEMNSKTPYMIWDKMDGVYVGAYQSRQRAIEWIESNSYYAKGGQTDSLYKIQQKYKYDLQPKWEDEKFQTGGRHFLTYKQAQEVKKKLQGLSSSMEYKVVKVEEKFAAGGELVDKTRIVVKSGNRGKLKEVFNAIKNQRSELNANEVFDNEKMKGKSVFLFVDDELYDQYIQKSDEDNYKHGGYMASGGELVDKTIDHSGRYLDIVGNHRMLHIHLNDEGREMVMEERENGRGDEEIMYELFEDVAGNSDLMYHTDLGESGFGMTDASGVTVGYMYGDDGELEPADDTAVVYVDNDSYRRSPIDEMLHTHLVLKNSDFMAKGGMTFGGKMAGAGIFADGGGIPQDKSLKYFIMNEASSGSIANKTPYNSYKDIDGVRLTAFQILLRDGDREYSLQNFTDLIKQAVEEYEENKYEMSYAKGGHMGKGGRTGKTLKVKDWYMKNYPTDDLGSEINDNISFKDLWAYMSQGYDVYDVLGVGDSLVRERVFVKLSEVYGVEYDAVYKMWLNS